MKFNKKLFIEIITASLSFIIPFILLIILFSVNGISLSGYNQDTVLMSDMQGQYIAYMRDFRRILLSDESLIYTTEKSFGGDYLSLFDFYLGSPFNLLVVFFKEEAIPLFFVWINIIKLSLAGLSFYFLMRFSYKFSYSHVIFSIGYGLMSYGMIYFLNYMWLDGVMILPVVILGLHFLKDKKHYWLYPLALAYALMTSWYIAFMIAIFIVLYFLYLFVTNFKKENGEFYKFLLRFAVFSLAAGLLSISYWLVAFVHLSGTKGFINQPEFKIYSISMFISGLLENNYAAGNLIRQNSQYISMFVGMVPLVFAITYFCNKEFSVVDRISVGTLVVIYVVFSLFSGTYALLHGGREPTWFPSRYAFIISFIICLLGARSFSETHKLHPLYYLVPAGIGGIAIIIVSFVKHSDRLLKYQISVPSLIIFYVTILFASVVSLFNYLKINKLDELNIKKYLPYALCALVIVQIASSYRGADKVLRVNQKENAYQQYEVYLKDCEYQGAIDAVKAYDKEKYNSPFYRMEMTFNRPGNYNSNNNNTMFYSYNGLSHFSSSTKNEVRTYMGKLGFQSNGFYASYDGGSTYALNSLLGMKYLVEDPNTSRNIHPYFVDLNTFNEISIDGYSEMKFYENPNDISLGFVIDKTSSYFINEGIKGESSVYWFDHFEYQNQIFKSFIKSIDKDIFKPLTVNSVSTTVSYTEDEYGFRTYHNVQPGDKVIISYTLPSEGYNCPLYFSEKNGKEDVLYRVDGRYVTVNSYFHKGIYSVKNTNTPTHDLLITFNEAFDHISIRPEFYYEDLSVTNEYLSALRSNQFKLESISNSLTKKSFNGSLEVVDNNKDLLFTLPYEKGIRVYIDNKLMKAETKWNIFTGVDLSSLELGTHSVRIEYQDDTFVLSLPISITSLLGIFPIAIYYNKIENLLFKKRKREE